MPQGENLTPELQSKAGRSSQKHGLYSMEFSGPDALMDPAKITRMAELREALRTQPGRDDVRHEMACRLVLMVEMGFDSIRERYEAEGVTKKQKLQVWKDPIIQVLPRYISAMQKAIDTLPKLFDIPKNVTDALDTMAVTEDA